MSALKMFILWVLLSLTGCASTASDVHGQVSSVDKVQDDVGSGEQLEDIPASNGQEDKIPIRDCQVMQVRTRNASIFKGPGHNYGMADRMLEKDDFIVFLSRSGFWIKSFVIKTQAIGWIHQGFLRLVQITDDLLPLQTISTRNLDNLKVGGVRGANVRTGPSVKHFRLFTLKRGSIINVLFEESGWVKVWIPHYQKIGWIYKGLTYE